MGPLANIKKKPFIHHAEHQRTFDFSGRSLDLAFPHVMGVLNVTPDSFSDGGDLFEKSTARVSVTKALAKAEAMVEAGAALIDIGGESTRPGAEEISSQEEIDRVVPVLEGLANNLNAVISVDTSNPALMALCRDYGVGLINDVRALGRAGALQAAAEAEIPVCLMHMQGQPATMQKQPRYSGLVEDITNFLTDAILACEQAGIARDKIIIDPGFGFGKTLAHNIELLSRLDQFQALQLPLLIGLSRKRMLGSMTGKAEPDRMAGGLAAAVIAVMQGANIIRTHDVAETVDAVKVCTEVLKKK